MALEVEPQKHVSQTACAGFLAEPLGVALAVCCYLNLATTATKPVKNSRAVNLKSRKGPGEKKEL
jgi:hypothetical protein